MRHALTATLILTLTGCASPGWFRAHSTGLSDNRLTPCPEAPRCQSSDASNPRHAIAPFTLAVPAEQAWPRIVEIAQATERSRTMVAEADYLHLEIDSPWGTYIDDLELHLRPAENIVAVRSSGRIGWYDFNVNRDRIEALRTRLQAAGLVQPSPHAAAP